jgi:hypothetical protein
VLLDRRRLVPLILGSIVARSTQSRANGDDLHLGDDGFQHDRFHPFYPLKEVFGGHCSCGDGDCRPSKWRLTELGSPALYDVWVREDWHPLPEKVYQPDRSRVPPELRAYTAHVCCYGPDYELTIPCALIFLTVS